MDFGMALIALKRGETVARTGWNGKGMFLTLQNGSTVDGNNMRNEGAKKYYEDVKCTIAPHIDMKSADGTYVVGWLASQTDMLAEDWEIVKPIPYKDEMSKRINELEVETEKLRALNAEAKNIGITQQLNLDLRKIEELRAENAKLKQIPTWHDLRKDPTDYPTEEDMLVRVILKDGSELICTTYEYFLTEDEIGYKGYGSSIIQFSQKNSTEDWVDDNDIMAWCEISKFGDKE